MILGCDFIIALKGCFLAGKLGVMRVVTSQLGFTRAFSIIVFITRNVPTVTVLLQKKVLFFCIRFIEKQLISAKEERKKN